MNTIDTIRAVFTYVICFVVVIGGLTIIYLTRLEPGSQDTIAIVAGFVGSALTFAFSSEVQTRTARQTNTAQLAGAATHANGSTLASTAAAAQGADGG